MEDLHTSGIVLSALMGLVLLVILWDIVRRADFPGLDHGRIGLPGRSMKWLWAIALSAGFVAGGPAVASHTTTSSPDGDSPAAAMFERAGMADDVAHELSWRWKVRVASYAHSVEVVHTSAGQAHRIERAAFHLPMWLPLGLLAYLLVVASPRKKRVDLPERTGRGG